MCDRACDVSQPDESQDQAPTDAIRTDGGIVGLGEILDCLTSARRRHLLYYLQDHEVANVEELATQIAAREASIPPAEVTDDHQERIATDLVHIHLPKLADTELIEYDRRSSTVRYANPPSLLENVLRLLAQLDEDQRT